MAVRCRHHVVLGTGRFVKYHPGGVGEAVNLNIRQERYARDWNATIDRPEDLLCRELGFTRIRNQIQKHMVPFLSI